MKDLAYVINLDGHNLIATHWIALHVDGDNGIYCNSFRSEYIPKEIKKFVDNKNIIKNVFRIQPYDSVMCGYFFIGFIDFMMKV